jgi:uncharacterized protein with PIN domain
MSRTGKAYEIKFRSLLARAGARRPDQGLRWFRQRVEQVARQEQVSAAQALTRVYRTVLRRMGRQPLPAPNLQREPLPRFICDAGLGGLARWLRAAGYEAAWAPDITDNDLVRQARQAGAVALTTDSLLMERRVLRDGEVPALWVPPSLTPAQQLELVFDELRLLVRPSLCMSCGGPLQSVDKEAARARIPPRTYLWLDRYFECGRCGRLFWHGTHWQRIQSRLQGLAGQPSPAPRAPDLDKRPL